MLQPNFTPFPTLTTERLVLRRITMDDLPERVKLEQDPRMRTYSRRAARTEEELRAVIEKVHLQIDTNMAISWVMTLRGDNTLIGDISFWRILHEHHRAETGYMLFPEHWGKGLASEALGAILDYGFNAMGLHSVEARVNPDNAPSIRLLEKHGFNREGYFKESEFYDGKFVDVAMYCRLREELRALRS